jgi:hypothetical protein
MCAAEHRAAGFVAVTDDPAPAMRAAWGKRVNSALETIEIMGDSVGYDFERLIVFVAANFAGLDPGVEFGRGLICQIRFQDSGSLFLLVSFDHTSNSE